MSGFPLPNNGVPDYVSLHPGYNIDTCMIGLNP